MPSFQRHVFVCINERAPELLAWESLPGSDVASAGSVRLKETATGTELAVSLQYSPPAGMFGRTIAKLFGEAPEQQIEEDLDRFKQLMEAGEISVSDGPGLLRPAQPSAEPDRSHAVVEEVRR